MSKKKIPEELQERLEKFHVDVPEITMKRSKIDRFANWIYAPARDPLEMLWIKGNSITKLAFLPFVVVFVLLFTPIFFI